MAYEDDYEATSPTSYGLAQNPLMPMGDPLAYARIGQAPETNAPGIKTPGLQPQPIQPPAPVNVPPITHGGGGGDPGANQLSLPQTQPGPDSSQLGGLGQLLQMKGMQDLIAPQSNPPGVTYTPGGAVAKPGAGAGPGRAPTGTSIAAAAKPYQDMVNDAAKQNGVDSNTLTRLLYKESQFNSKAASPAGARGIGQFMPQTAKEEGVDVTDPKSSIYGAAKYYAKMKNTVANGNDQLAMAAYNWGPGNLQKWLKNGADPSKLPAETRDYVNFISGRPLAPNKVGDIPSAAAAPMAAMIAGQGGGFVAPPVQSAGGATAPEFGRSPKPGQMSPHGGPYIQGKDGIYATDGDGKVVGPAVKSIDVPQFNPNQTEAVPSKGPAQSSALGPDQGTPNLGGGVSKGAIDPNKIVPGNAAPATAPTVPAPSESGPAKPDQTPKWMPDVPTQAPNMQNDPRLQKLWQYMLIKSLFPQLQFRNVGYDPWAVHRFGQGGGY